MCTGIPHANNMNKNALNEIEEIAKNCSGLRSMGSAGIDLAYVAAGKFDAFWEKNLNLWDVSAGIILVKEAGGKITQPDGKEWNSDSRDILVSNTKIHEKMLEKLKTN